MKNTIKLFGIIALAALIGFTMTACPEPDDKDKDPDPKLIEDITWELGQVGGVAGEEGAAPTATTTAITITFSEAVELKEADITISGAATRNSATDLSSDADKKVWTVPVTVTHTDNATVAINKTGVESGQKTVLVYKEGEKQAISWKAEADGEEGTTTSTKITFTFSEDVEDLDVEDITLTNENGTATKGELTGSGKTWVLNITVTTPGIVSVAIDKDGISATHQSVEVYKEGEEAQDITWTAAVDGVADTTDSTKITITFSLAVSDLTTTDITLTSIVGSATKGTLTHSEADEKIWELDITVTTAGTISVAITKEGIDNTSQTVTVHKFKAITWTAVANGNTDTETSTQITFTFSEDVEDLEVEDITITDGTGSIEELGEYSLYGEGTEWTLSIDVTTQGNIKIKIEKEGIDASEQTVAVHKAIPAVTYTVTADGTESSVDSTKITFTFSEAVTGLALNDITLYDRTGKAAKGNAAPTSSDNGITWELGITVTRAKAIVVKITKAGVSAGGKNVVVHKSGAAAANPVNGVITWLYDSINFSASQLVFSDSNNGSGTYTLNGFSWGSSDWDNPAGEGTWAWNNVNSVVTLTATKMDIYGELVDATEAAAAYLDQVEMEAEEEIATYFYMYDYSSGEWVEKEDYTREDAIEDWLDETNYYLGTSYASLEEYIAGEAAKRAGDLFAPRVYTYVYSADSTLILLEAALPVSDGTDPLAARTFTISSEWGGSQEFEFGNDGTYSTTNGMGDAVEGSYSCTSDDYEIYRVQLQPTTIDGKTPAEYYDDAEYWGDEFSNYPSEADDRTLQTNQQFAMTKLVYNSSDDMLAY